MNTVIIIVAIVYAFYASVTMWGLKDDEFEFVDENPAVAVGVYFVINMSVLLIRFAFYAAIVQTIIGWIF